MGQPPDNMDGADTRATETLIAINMEQFCREITKTRVQHSILAPSFLLGFSSTQPPLHLSKGEVIPSLPCL